MDALEKVHALQKSFSRKRRWVALWRALLFALALTSLAGSFVDFFPLQEVLLFIVIFVAVFILGSDRLRLIGQGDIELFLEVAEKDSWEDYADRLKQFEKEKLCRDLSTLLWPILLFSLTVPQMTPLLKKIKKNGEGLALIFYQGSTLKVVQGSKPPLEDGDMITLGKNEATIHLMNPNLIEVHTLLGKNVQAPTLELLRPGEQSSYQRLQFIKKMSEEEQSFAEYTLRFSVSETSELSLPTLSSKLLLTINVDDSLVPTVKLEMQAPLKDPWLDDEPVPLLIKAKAHEPLQEMRIVLRHLASGSEEIVTQVSIDPTTNYEHSLSLALEPYLQGDIDRLELKALVFDSSKPNPQVGQSASIVINVASAYGQYRLALEAFKRLKENIDQAKEHKDGALTLDKPTDLDDAFALAEKTPYFDLLDRLQIKEFKALTLMQKKAPKQENLMQLSERLDAFLWEHETLDDRERDRDFFVALRSLARFLSGKNDRLLSSLKQNLQSFLKERHGRWESRVGRLADTSVLKEWPKVQKKPFSKAVDKIEIKHEEAGQASISNMAKEYRAWIEELEKQEDLERQKMEQNREQTILSAQKKLREIQVSQNGIATALDQADQKPKDQLKDKWPIERARQKGNGKDTQALANEVKMVSPLFAQRLAGAADAMEDVVRAGDKEDFVRAESAADVAGRLLRQAEKDSMSNKSGQGQERRKRKRVAGNQYYGQAMQGADIQIRNQAYEVDRRYREDILDELNENRIDGQEKSLIENYLRRVVR